MRSGLSDYVLNILAPAHPVGLNQDGKAGSLDKGAGFLLFPFLLMGHKLSASGLDKSDPASPASF